MDEKKWIRIALYAAAGLLAAYLAVQYLLPVAVPFLIGALIAKLCDPAVRFLMRKSQMPRWVCSGAAIGLFYLLLGTGLTLLCRQILRELTELARQLPALLASLAAPAARLRVWLEGLAERAPDGLGEALENYAGRLFSGSSGWLDTLNDRVLAAATSFLTGLPGAVLLLVTAVLSSFLLSSRLPDAGRWVRSAIPARHRGKVTLVADRLKRAFGGWCVAQLKLMGVTFCIVTSGLFFIGIDYALLLGLLIALIDALPVFGTGTVLIPWGLLMFARGQTRCGFGLLILYGAATLTRTALEPKLVGRQIGLNPLITLLAIYAGYRTVGLAGMILFPIGTLLVKQLWDYYRSAAE